MKILEIFKDFARKIVLAASNQYTEYIQRLLRQQSSSSNQQSFSKQYPSCNQQSSSDQQQPAVSQPLPAIIHQPAAARFNQYQSAVINSSQHQSTLPMPASNAKDHLAISPMLSCVHNLRQG